MSGYDVSGYVCKIYPGRHSIVTIVLENGSNVDCHLYEIELDIKRMRELKLKDILDEKR